MKQVNLSLNKIFQMLCPGCKEKVIAIVKEAMTDQAIRDSLEGKVDQDEQSNQTTF